MTAVQMTPAPVTAHHVTLDMSFDPAEPLAFWVDCVCGWTSGRYATVTGPRRETDGHTSDVLTAEVAA